MRALSYYVAQKILLFKDPFIITLPTRKEKASYEKFSL